MSLKLLAPSSGRPLLWALLRLGLQLPDADAKSAHQMRHSTAPGHANQHIPDGTLSPTPKQVCSPHTLTFEVPLLLENWDILFEPPSLFTANEFLSFLNHSFK